MKAEQPIPAKDQVLPAGTGVQPISIRKLDRLETTNFSNSQGA
jgi:hypothetical protein